MWKRYTFLVFVAAAIAAGIYQVASQYLTADWQKLFLMIAMLGAWIPLFWRWLMAIIDDPRDPLGIKDAG